MNIDILKKLGFSDKNAQIYLALVKLGPSSVRKLAEFCDLNRGTTYDSLKWLQEKGMVSFYKSSSKQLFVVEDPEKLRKLAEEQRHDLDMVNVQLDKVVSELQALHNKGGERPVARYCSGKELANILEDVLESCEQTEEKEYFIYSAEGLREYLYKDFTTFSDVRIAKGISVKVIALGDGGELRGLDERRWLGEKSQTPTYIIIYSGKTAYISLNAKEEPVGVVIENEGVYETQKHIFINLWNKLAVLKR